MRSAALILSFGTGAILLQTTILHPAVFGSTPPDLVLVLCVYLGLYYQRVGGALGAFFLGYLLDTFSGANFGINAFGMTFVYLFIYLLSRRLWIEGVLPNILVVLAAAVVKAVAVVVLLAVVSEELVGAPDLGSELVSGATAAVLTPLVFGLLRRGKLWLGVV
jgi:rod shape-determining protein MreD